MSNLLIQAYFAELNRLKKFSGSLTEGIVSEALQGFAEGVVEAIRPDLPEPIRVRITIEEPDQARRHHRV